MRTKGLSQEWLKGIACLSMLIDHIGVTWIPLPGFRVIGRIAFPLFCFLICQGVRYTKDPANYILRLLVLAAVSELPYDLMAFGAWDAQRQNAVFTLLLGACAALCLRNAMLVWWKRAVLVSAVAIAAQWLRLDYGGYGIVLIATIAILEEHALFVPILAAMLLAMGILMPSMGLRFGVLEIPVSLFGAAAVIPIAWYSGEKQHFVRWHKWGFYLFYPIHMLVLWLMGF